MRTDGALSVALGSKKQVDRLMPGEAHPPTLGADSLHERWRSETQPDHGFTPNIKIFQYPKYFKIHNLARLAPKAMASLRTLVR
jgi:hypothetical protein